MPFWYADVEPGYCNWIKPEGLICGEKLPEDNVEVMLCNRHLVQAVLAHTEHHFTGSRRSRIQKVNDELLG